MSVNMHPEAWYAVARTEYLQDFVKQGGSAVKFLVPVSGPEMAVIESGLRSLAGDEDFFYAAVDASSVRIHLIEQVFHQVARQVDWQGLTHAFLRRLLREHYILPENRGELNLKQIAMLNGYDERDIRLFINTRLREALFHDYAMIQEFRIAMMMLCRCLLDPDEVSADLCSSVEEWLRGDLKRVSALKKALIFQKIGRHNARQMLFSLAHWLHLCGHNGLFLALDISRYTQDRPKELDGSLYYSTPAMLDCYEVLRQFIDATDESEFCFTVVLAPPRFLDEGEKRSVSRYDALKTRIWDEVRDKAYTNPLSPLVRICAC
jgi:hypothetical protein